ncbi:MAG: HAD family hydrolase [Woeseiaceae bacterium]
MIVAAFDFDGTLTRGDTLFPFLRFVSGYPRFAAKSCMIAPTLCRLAVANIDNHTAKERVLRRFLLGRSRDELADLGRQFADRVLPRMLRREAMDRLRWHQELGHNCILLSASLDIYLEPWARHERFDKLACSVLEMDGAGRATGALKGRNCYGAEKVRRLRELIDEGEISELYAYGDNKGDQDVLAIANHAYHRKFSE